jgi:hypothetical protein
MFEVARVLREAGHAVGDVELDPWGGLPEDDEALQRIVDVMASLDNISASDRTIEDPYGLVPYRLGGRLLDAVGPVLRHERLVECQEPDVLVLMATGEAPNVSRSVVDTCLVMRWGLAVLEDACDRRGQGFDEVMRWCWMQWVEESSKEIPPIAWAADDRWVDDAESAWRALPASALTERLVRNLNHRPRAWAWVSDEVWSAWLVGISEADLRGDESKMLSYAPEHLARQAIKTGLVGPWSHDARSMFWRDRPQMMLELIDELAGVVNDVPPPYSSHDGPLADLVASAPHDQGDAVLERMDAWSADLDAYAGVHIEWVRWVLMRQIDMRVPTWRRAFTLLDKVGVDRD